MTEMIQQSAMSIAKDQANIETLNAGEETIAKQLAKLYTK